MRSIRRHSRRSEVDVGIVTFQLPSGAARRAGRMIPLSAAHRSVVRCLARQPGALVTEDDLTRVLAVNDVRHVRTLLGELRQLLDPHDTNEVLEVFPGLGARLHG